MNGYDIHTHSVYSDGTTQVNEIARLAAMSGLPGFALTDHDTVAGWEQARKAAAQYGLDFLPGVELDTKFGQVDMHLLGYGFDPEQGGMQTKLDQLQQARASRIEQMVVNLAADYEISLTQLQQRVLGTVGRPHIADELMRLGVVPDRATAFATILHKDSKYYVAKQSFHTLEAVRLIVAAGGVPVLAHPAAIRHKHLLTAEQLAQLVAAGLQGIELRHPENCPAKLAEIMRFVPDFDLLITGSSDFHGAGKSNRVGDCTTPAEIIAEIRARCVLPN